MPRHEDLAANRLMHLEVEEQVLFKRQPLTKADRTDGPAPVKLVDDIDPTSGSRPFQEIKLHVVDNAFVALPFGLGHVSPRPFHRLGELRIHLGLDGIV